MAFSQTTNRSMFWRILRRLLFANPARLLLILLALGAGAAVTAALLNLQIDAKRRLTTEFRAFGPNVLILPNGVSSSTGTETLPESTVRSVPLQLGNNRVGASSLLYVVVKVSTTQSGKSFSVVIIGSNPRLVAWTAPRATDLAAAGIPSEPICMVGGRIGKQLQAQQNDQLTLSNGDASETCRAAGFGETGGPEDDQIGVDLRAAQRLANLPGRISNIALNVPGTPAGIQSYINQLQLALPDVEVHPVRQFTDAQAKIYSRISGLLNFTVVLVLVLTSLCVLAVMT